ncbi:MAG: hypothetical protein ABEK01_04335 [Candidatus Nanohaloarchaea archaeon]
MKRKTVMVLVLAVSVLGLVGQASSYTVIWGSGGYNVATGQCNNGVDDDGDSYTDGNDPGCTKPYSEDNLEGNIYDLDMSWIFGQKSSAGIKVDAGGGPSVFYGWAVRSTTGTTWGDQSRDSNTRVNETYVKLSSSLWGGGKVAGKVLPPPGDVSGFYALNSVNSPYYQLIGWPKYGDCGDTIEDTNEVEEGSGSCVPDVGLPDDPSSYAENGKSENTMTDAFNHYVGQWNLNNLNGVSVGDPNNDANTADGYVATSPSDDLSDNIRHDMDFKAGEPKGAYWTDVSGTSDEKDPEVTFEDDQWENVPDYYRKNEDEIWMVYPKKVGENHLGTVTDWDLTTDTYEDYDVNYNSATVCESGVTNATCAGSETHCQSVDQDTVYDEDLDKDNWKTLSASTDLLETSRSGSQYSTVVSSQSLSLDVKHDDKGGGNYIDADDKPSSCQSYDSYCNPTGQNAVCSWKDVNTISVNNGNNVNDEGNIGEYNPGYEKDTPSYYWEDLEYRTAKIFDLSSLENPGGSPGNPEDILFWGDSFSGNSYSSVIVKNMFNGDTYWSVIRNLNNAIDSKTLGNDQAVSSSSFRIRIDSSNHFVSVRNFFQTWDADGPQGRGDGIMAILDRDKGDLSGSGNQMRGSTNEFLQREVTTGDYSTSFVSKSDVPMSRYDCPGPFHHCLAAIDVHMKDLDEWYNPTDPGEGSNPNFMGVEFHTTPNGPYSTNESLGACEAYKNLDPQSRLISRYDEDRDSPTQMDERCIGDMPNDYKIYMEGPEISEAAVKVHPANFQTRADKISDCNLRGRAVPEGHVADVSSTRFTEYEEGGWSPDWEVCLNIDNGNPGGPGDEELGDNYDYDYDLTNEELGGEWWDLDNDRINEYLRNNENRLIDNGNSGDPHDIAYYWRANVNPQHNDYNPQGGNGGVPLEDDCGPQLDGCSEEESESSGKNPVFYSFLEEAVP